MPPPSSSTTDGCMVSDITADYAPLECTGAPPINACGYPASKAVITGPAAVGGVDCTTFTTAALTAFGRRCHLLTGLTPGDTIKFRWRFTSDPGSEFKGFYLDDIAVTNIRLPNSCTGVQAPAALSAESVMTHGGAGTFGENLPLGSRGIEPRLGTGSGAGRGYTFVVHFDQPVNGGSATLTGNGSAGSPTFSGNDMTIPLSNVTDVQTVSLTLNNVTTPSGGNLSSASLQIGFFAGDVTASGNVNAADVGSVKANSGATVSGANFRNDVVVTGMINAADVGQVKALSGGSLNP